MQNKFRELRKKAGLKQEYIAHVLKVGQSTISGWETGIATPRADKLHELSAALNCSVDELLTHMGL